jgi:hypothetical protein
MKLADLRKLCVRQNLRIRFQLPNGLECVMTEQGVARVPALSGTPDFNLERELVSIGEFVLESAAPAARKTPDPPRHLRREELESLAAPQGAAAGADREDE